MIRTPLALVPYLIAIAAVVGGLLWHAGDTIAQLERAGASGTASVGGPFALTDQNGLRRSDREFRGRYVLVYFGYTRCPDVCPTTLAMLSDAMEKLGAQKSHVVPIFITVDPERDTPSALKAYLGSFGPEFVGLTGTLGAVRTVAKEYRAPFAKHALPGGIGATTIVCLMRNTMIAAALQSGLPVPAI